MPRISVVIPSFNHAGFIKQAIYSVLNQTYSDLELIVVDDGSTDQSIAAILDINDSRLHIFQQTNQGAHAAINRGLHIANGEYLSILNSDDVYHPQRLEKMLKALESQRPAQFAGSYVELINSTGQATGVKHGYHDLEPWPLELKSHSFRTGNDLHATLLTENYFATTSNFFFTRECYEQIGEFRNLRYVHDWDFALRAALITPLVLVPEPLIQYRIHPHNTIREDRAAMVYEICWCLAMHLSQHISSLSSDFHPDSKLVDQLLNSIFVYGCDKVLAVMLAQEPASHPEVATELLNPANPIRISYMEFIRLHIDNEKGAKGERDNVGSSLNGASPLVQKLSHLYTELLKRFCR